MSVVTSPFNQGGFLDRKVLSLLRAFRELWGDVIVRQAWRSGKEGVVFSLVAFIMLLQKELMLFQYNGADGKHGV
jgi:hypothetical protein